MKFARYELNGTIGYGIVSGENLKRPIRMSIRRIQRDRRYCGISGCPTPRTDHTDKSVSCRFELSESFRRGTGADKIQKSLSKRPPVSTTQSGNIELPDGDDDVHAEGELVVIMKERTQKATPEEAAANILGVTCGNDVSARTWQSNDLQWWRAKASDTFGPIGPVIATDVDYTDAQLETRINGRGRSETDNRRPYLSSDNDCEFHLTGNNP